jgi:hypothetical protein
VVENSLKEVKIFNLLVNLENPSEEAMIFIILKKINSYDFIVYPRR